VSAAARRAFVGLGSNLGDRLAHLERAAELLAAAGDAVAASSVYETEPVGGPEQGPYLNAVVELSTTDAPRQILERCRAAERDAGRTRTVRFGPRTLDADVLLVGDERVDEPDLVVPHPRMYERRFVLVPLSELAPGLVTPEMLERAFGDVRRVGMLTRFATSVTRTDR
jgi:2-amino-4-hydroxy-6-hydroxymethyldihydropteridine diphosphokinase